MRKRNPTEPGFYNVFTADGNYVSWYRHFKDAKYHAEKIGGTAIKVPATAKTTKPWTGPMLRLDDGSMVPFTRANLKAAQKKQNPATTSLPKNKWLPGQIRIDSKGQVQFKSSSVRPRKENDGIKFMQREDGWYWNVSSLTGPGFGPFESAKAAEDSAYRRNRRSALAPAPARIERDKATGRYYRV